MKRELGWNHHLEHKDLIRRAKQPNSMRPRAFLKWAGSKRFLLSHIAPHLPIEWNTYREPFLGSGAMFFLLRPKRANLSDKSQELIETFTAVRDNPAAVTRYLTALDSSRDTYYHVRSNRSRGRFKRAAEFIYLNKTCWNGLYRVNAAGEFNVPYGWPKGPNKVDTQNLHDCAVALSSEDVSLTVSDFEDNLGQAESGDLVYLDPPYVTGHNNNGFVDYNEVLFSWADQIRLAEIARELVHRGVFVVVSNANHDAVLNLYPEFRAVPISRTSTLAANPMKRGRVSEVLMVGKHIPSLVAKELRHG
jgi:DNA adenine methylase